MCNKNELAKLHAEVTYLKELNKLQSENNTGTPLQIFTQGRMEQLAKEKAANEFRRRGGTLY
jgi:hypothetical protein